VDSARLAAVPLLAEIPAHELDAVARVATELELPAGKELTTEGDFGHTVFVIEEGSAEVIRDGTRIGLAGPGDIVGEIAVLASGRRTASVRATSPLKVIALFKRDVWALEREAPEASRRLRSALTDRDRS
jgi:CRP/FNR family transcriptional regulator, cyclic AMP receptor protein